MRRAEILSGIHQYDKAQVALLARQGLAPRETVRALAGALRDMESNDVAQVRGQLWNVIHGGEEYLRNACGETNASYIHIGRSSPSIRVVASRIALREKLLTTLDLILGLQEVLLRKAETHLDTVMPGYAYIQHAELETFGHYLVSWAEALCRDCDRFLNAYDHVNVSSAGTEGGYGSQFDLDLDLLDDLLGFTRVPLNARDSMRNYDYMIECYTALAILHNTLGRLALDFLIWSSKEFGLIQIADELSVTSSIASQMRIPYVLEFVSGLSGVTAGALMSALATSKTASDQLEPATLLPMQYLQTNDESQRALRAMSQGLASLEVRVERMGDLAGTYWAQTSTVIGFLVRERGLPYRVAHQILAGFNKEYADRGVTPRTAKIEMLDAVAKEHIGASLNMSQADLDGLLDPQGCVAARHFRGGTSPDQVRSQISDLGAIWKANRSRVDAHREALAGADQRLSEAFDRALD
jgi:argininosuccinate lyase